MKRLLVAALLLFPLCAFPADVCIKSTAAPNYSSYADGAPVPMSCDPTGNVRTTGSGGGGGSTTANQGTAAADSGSWPAHLVFGTTALSLGQALMASSIPVVISSNQSAFPVTLTSTTITGTVAVTQSTSPWVNNISQFGGSNIVTGTGVGGAGIPRFTISSDSFPTFQNVIAVGNAVPLSAVAPVVGGSAVSSLVLKASSGSLFSVYATCSAACYLMVFNSTTAPSNGSTTAGIASGNMQECVGPSTNPNIAYTGLPPSTFSVGITSVISSTGCGTLTLATTGFVHGTIQ